MGHPEIAWTFGFIKRIFDVPNLKQKVQDYIELSRLERTQLSNILVMYVKTPPLAGFLLIQNKN